MANYVFINDFGQIWRFSQRNYAKWMLAFAEGKNPSPKSFRGKEIGQARAVRDLTPEQANVELRADKESFDLLKPKEVRALGAVSYAENGEVIWVHPTPSE